MYYMHPRHGKCVIIRSLGDGVVWINRHFLRGTVTVREKELTPIRQGDEEVKKIASDLYPKQRTGKECKKT